MSGKNENEDCCDSASDNKNLRLALKKCYQKIDWLEHEVFRYKMLLAGESEMMNSLGWSKPNPEKRCGD